jgi:hypothetical protein
MTPDAVATRLETLATQLRAGPDSELTVTALRDLEHRLHRLVTDAFVECPELRARVRAVVFDRDCGGPR